jgi:hypothetical protein
MILSHLLSRSCCLAQPKSTAHAALLHSRQSVAAITLTVADHLRCLFVSTDQFIVIVVSYLTFLCLHFNL